MMLNGRAASAVWATIPCFASPHDVPHAGLGCRALHSKWIQYGTRELIHDGGLAKRREAAPEIDVKALPFVSRRALPLLVVSGAGLLVLPLLTSYRRLVRTTERAAIHLSC